MNKKVIIIGAGIGGLSTALRLLKNGYEIVIYEFGGTILTGVPVEEIIFLDDTAIGVKSSRGTENADILVCMLIIYFLWDVLFILVLEFL